MQKLPISRLRLSGRLLGMTLESDVKAGDLFARLCRILAAERINIEFSASATREGVSQNICCIAEADDGAARRIILKESRLSERVRFLTDVGLVALFPHHHRLKALGLALQGLSKEGIQIYSLASSVAAITFVIDFTRLEDAVSALCGYFEPPSGCRAEYPQFEIRQIPVPRNRSVMEGIAS